MYTLAGKKAYLVRGAASHGANDILGCASDAVDDGLEGGGLVIGRHDDDWYEDGKCFSDWKLIPIDVFRLIGCCADEDVE